MRLKNPTSSPFGKLLDQALKKNGTMSISSLAGQCGISIAQISFSRSGKHPVSKQLLGKILSVLTLSAQESEKLRRAALLSRVNLDHVLEERDLNRKPQILAAIEILLRDEDDPAYQALRTLLAEADD